MGILFNSTALGIHFCETSLIFNFKTRLGGEICLCDVNMHKGYCLALSFLKFRNSFRYKQVARSLMSRESVFLRTLMGTGFSNLQTLQEPEVRP